MIEMTLRLSSFRASSHDTFPPQKRRKGSESRKYDSSPTNLSSCSPARDSFPHVEKWKVQRTLGRKMALAHRVIGRQGKDGEGCDGQRCDLEEPGYSPTTDSSSHQQRRSRQ